MEFSIHRLTATGAIGVFHEPLGHALYKCNFGVKENTYLKSAESNQCKCCIPLHLFS